MGINVHDRGLGTAAASLLASALGLLSGAAQADFQITSLTTNNGTSIQHANITADDRGGIAVSLQRVFYTGDGQTGMFDLPTLANPTSLFGTQYDALVGDLLTSKVYDLGDASGAIQGTTSYSGTLTRLFEINGANGSLTGTQIALSTPIAVTNGNTGIFAGAGYILIANNTSVFKVDLPSGTVTNLGAMGLPSHSSCESWAFWGVAENTGSTFFVDSADPPFIRRTRVPDGLQTTIANFSGSGGLADMCSFTVQPRMNRWYFHYEGSGILSSGSDETLGYADATFSGTPTFSFDFGDAPSPFPTILAIDGARHAIVTGPFLGTVPPDADADGQPQSSALGDDQNGAADEDGIVVIIDQKQNGTVGIARVTVSGAPGLLDGWIDFNRNGSWLNPGEKIFSSQPVGIGTSTQTFTVPPSAVITGPMFARFRLSTFGGLPPTGPAVDGEVEDYVVNALSTTSGGGNGGSTSGGTSGTGCNGDFACTSGGVPSGSGGSGGGALPLATLAMLLVPALWRRRRAAQH